MLIGVLGRRKLGPCTNLRRDLEEEAGVQEDQFFNRCCSTNASRRSKEAAVAELQRRFLEDIPFPAALGPTNSLYDHANIRYGGKIVLREHFRCVPEIIQFSNDLCYAPSGTPLIPLRTYPPNRLRPVVTRFVEEGYQEGSGSSVKNLAEAESLAGQVAACLDDPRYEGKTFGIISLLGNRQARLIQQALTQFVGPEKMEERELVCGDAYAFQGDERDVMFLSMVSAPNARIGALTGLSAQQRFNVAASRAKDQLWLFHSVKPEDLSAQCVRRRLLEYCMNPSRAPLPFGLEELNDFEKDVFEMISTRGYHVRGQVPAGDQTSHRYRIDLVVEGMEGRLAVECDGDRWHGPDTYEQDMARQRQLERAGWRFFRVRGGSFYRDPEGALAPLWRELEELGIRPGWQQSDIDDKPPVSDAKAVSIEIRVEDIGSENTEKEIEDAVAPAEESELNPAEDSKSSTTQTQPHLFDGTEGKQQAPSGKKRYHRKIAKRTKIKGLRSAKKGKKPYTEEDRTADKEYVDRVPAEEWWSLSHWAKLQVQLQPWQRSLAYSIGRYKKQEWELSDKQYRQAAKAHREAVAAGFKSEEERQWDLFSNEAAPGDT